MKLTVDCEVSNQLPMLHHDSALTYLLSRANTKWLDCPLEELVCNQHGLKAESDYPLAAIAARADGINVIDSYWLRADPVYLTMQRDSFNLGEPAPLSMEREHADSMVASLNQHFNQEGLTFFVGNSGAWYLQIQHVPDIKTSLPSMAMGKNIFEFMPQGEASAKWRAYLNEVQMLLFSHPANAAREATGAPVVNSIWLSGGGVMPLHVAPNNDVDLIVADSVFYHGLAQWSGLLNQPVAINSDSNFNNLVTYQHVRLQLQGKHLLNSASFQVLFNALKTKKIKELTLNLGCYERTLIATITYWDTLKFWRKSKPVIQFFT